MSGGTTNEGRTPRKGQKGIEAVPIGPAGVIPEPFINQLRAICSA